MHNKSIIILIFFSLFLAQDKLFAQNGLLKGDRLPEISASKLLNAPVPAMSFSSLKKKIVILDFFGTWCVPCLKALPVLAGIHAKYKEDVSIVLVSNESNAQLLKFINKRPGFLFPIIVDEDDQWNKLFQPPALPYTVVIKDDQVIAITEAEKITAEAIEGWLGAKVMSGIPAQESINKSAPDMGPVQSENAAVKLSQDFIYAAKTGEPVEALVSSLSDFPYEELLKSVMTDNTKKAFWINLYNGYTQAALKKNPQQYKKRNTFFKKKNIFVAGQKMSLDDIEHDILRRSKIKWSLGYLNKFFTGKKEKQLRVAALDYRVHFALNCGAKSCPPIAFYSEGKLDQQLDLAAKAFLSSDSEYDKQKNIIYLPKLMSWFRADFGGKKGIINILKKYEIIPLSALPEIKFKEYDWSLALNNYTNQHL